MVCFNLFRRHHNNHYKGLLIENPCVSLSEKSTCCGKSSSPLYLYALLQVGDVNFENMSNDDAVRVLRECVHKPGPIMLTVAKCWDPTPKGYFTVPRNDVTRPIDPAAWMQHSEAVRASGGLLGGRPGSPSMSTMTSTSDSLTSSIPEADRYLDHSDLGLSIKTEMNTVVKVMASADSGLVVRDRMWLKITIPNAFIGSDLVDWLFAHVEGFADRRDARKYASKLLKANLIKHTVNKVTFSEQCYYVFGDYNGPLKGMADTEDNDVLAPLPNNLIQQTGSWVGQSPYIVTPGMPMMHPAMMMPRGPGSVSGSEIGTLPPNFNVVQMQGQVPPPPNYMDMFPPQMFQQVGFNPYFAQHSDSQGSHHTGSNSGGSEGSLRNQQLTIQQQQQQMVAQQQQNQSMLSQQQQNQQMLAQQQNQQMLLQQQQQQQMLSRDLDQLTIRSSGSSERSHSSRGSRESKRVVAAPATSTHVETNVADNGQQVDATVEKSNLTTESEPFAQQEILETPRNDPSRELGRLDSVPPEISASRQSFRMAMGNSSNEFFVDVM